MFWLLDCRFDLGDMTHISVFLYYRIDLEDMAHI